MGLLGVVEYSRVELHELHISHRSLGAIDHCNAVARGDDGVRGGKIDGATATCTHDGNLRKIGINLLRLGVEHVCPVALDVGRTAGDALAQMVLGDDLHSKVILLDVDVRILTHSLHQSALNLSSRIIGVMQDAELRMPALTMQVERAVVLLVEVDTPFHELFNLLGSLAHHLLNGLLVGNIVAGNDCIGNVLVEGVDLQVCYRGYAALCKRGVRLVERSLTDHTYAAFVGLRYFQCVAHTCHTSTDHQEIVFVHHRFLTCFLFIWCKGSYFFGYYLHHDKKSCIFAAKPRRR